MTREKAHTHNMAKGTFHQIFAQLFFLGSGYIIHLILARKVTPLEYGRFGVVLALLMIVELFFKQGIPFSASKHISEGCDTNQVRRKSKNLQLTLSLIIFILIFINSPNIATTLKDPGLTPYLQLASLIIPIRSLFALNFGILNGFKKFKESANLILINGLARITFVIILVYLGFQIFGAITGYILGALMAYLFSIKHVKIKRPGKNISTHEIFNLSVYLVGFSISYIAIMNLDILFVKALLPNPEDVGFFNAAKVLSGIIFATSNGLAITLFPSISESYSKGDFKQTRKYVENSLRYLLILVLPAGVICVLMSSELLTLFFPPEYSKASGVLGFMVFEMIFLSFFVTLGSIISGVGQAKKAMKIGVALIFIDIFLSIFLITEYGLLGGALAPFIVSIFGLLIFSKIVHNLLHTLIPLKSFLKITISTIPLLIISILITPKGLMILPFAGILYLGYFFTLYLIGEFNELDVKLVKNLIKSVKI